MNSGEKTQEKPIESLKKRYKPMIEIDSVSDNSFSGSQSSESIESSVNKLIKNYDKIE